MDLTLDLLKIPNILKGLKNIFLKEYFSSHLILEALGSSLDRGKKNLIFEKINGYDDKLHAYKSNNLDKWTNFLKNTIYQSTHKEN